MELASAPENNMAEVDNTIQNFDDEVSEDAYTENYMRRYLNDRDDVSNVEDNLED